MGAGGGGSEPSYNNHVNRTFADGAISVNPEIMGGSPVFTGTRVLVESLFHYLESGETINNFLEGFPTVTREQATAAIQEARNEYLRRIGD